MILYKARIKPLASFSSPLQSDTFFGAFCWSYRYMYGEDALINLLDTCINYGPKIVFSNAYPEGYLPLPMGTYDLERQRYSMIDKMAAKQAYQNNKKYKKCALIKRSAFCEIQKGNRRGFSKYLSKECTEQYTVVHNMVARDSGTVGNIDGTGNLFVSNEYFLKPEECLDVYILSSISRDTLETVMHRMLETGIGGKKSIGKGIFKLIGFDEEKELCAVDNANAYVALSNFIPAENDPVEGQYKTLVKYGKLDKQFASGNYPFKKPMLYIQAGATFKTDCVKEYYGACIHDIAAIEGVISNACTIAIPIIIPEES